MAKHASARDFSNVWTSEAGKRMMVNNRMPFWDEGFPKHRRRALG